MKKFLGIMMVLMMVIGLMIPVFASAGSVAGRSTMYVYCANGKRLNLRVAPSMNAARITLLETGTQVAILGDYGDGWAKVSAEGKTGFVKTAFLRSAQPAAANNSSFKSFSAKVYSADGKKVNMRVSANIRADRIAQLESYTTITVIGQVGDWYKIRWANATGYMMKKYVCT